MDVIDEDAATIGAVNTVVNREGALYGYNTDYYGFAYLLQKNGVSVQGKKVLVLGNGGVAQPVFHYLKKFGAGEVVVVKRSEAPGVITYEEARALHSDADIIINASPVGMFPNVEESPMTLEGYDHLSAVVDLIANPLETKLMQYAKAKGVPAFGGLEMLVAQAKLAEELFRDISLEEDSIEPVVQVISDIMNGK